MSKSVPIGTRAQVTNRVAFEHTLGAHHETLPQVLSTPTMISWMEAACFMAQQPFCEEGEVTVGTAVNVQHRAPTGIGATVTAEAVLDSIEGRFYVYKVHASDGEKQLGCGTVHRAVVNMQKFKEKTQKVTAT